MGIYFDHAATSCFKPEAVYDAVDRFQRQIGASPGRGAYRRALEAEQVLFDTRQLLGRLFRVRDVTRLVFTANVTESLNLAKKGFLRRGDHVVTGQLEHNAVWRTLKVLERTRDITITVIPCPGGIPFRPAAVERALTTQSRQVVLTHASNVTGTLLPVREVGELCRRRAAAAA